MILLSEKGMEKIVHDAQNADSAVFIAVNRGHWEIIVPLIAKAQAKNIHSWGNEACPHGRRRRRACSKCWQQLKQEIG